MDKTRTEADYNAAMKRIDELLLIIKDESPCDDPNMNELVLLSELVEMYEDIHYPFPPAVSDLQSPSKEVCTRL